MSEKNDPKTTAKSNPTGAATGATKVRWNDSKMSSTYANVCNVASTREEVTLLFGTNQSWHNAGKEVVVELSNRIILNPFAAKRLAVLLNNVMAQYEERFGSIDLLAQATEHGGSH